MHAASIDAVGDCQQIRRGFRHHDGGVGQLDELGEDGPLPWHRLLQDGMKRGDGRDVECPDEVEDVFTVLTAPDPVLVLDRDDVDASAQSAGGADVVAVFVLADPMVDFDRIRGRLLRRIEDDDLTAVAVCRQVVGEGGDAAVSRRVGGNKGSANDGVAPGGVVPALRRTDARLLVVHHRRRCDQATIGCPGHPVGVSPPGDRRAVRR